MVQSLSLQCHQLPGQADGFHAVLPTDGNLRLLLAGVEPVSGFGTNPRFIMKNECLHLQIVEDEAAHVEAIRRAFDQAGAMADIQSAGTLREYRDIIAAHPPDLALVDLNLPDGRATEILTHPAADAPFPILVMTAFGNQQIVVEVMKAGALDYVVKSPEAFAAMPQTVARALREWQLLQQQKRAEETLRTSEERYRRLFDESLDGICLADAQTGMI